MNVSIEVDLAGWERALLKAIATVSFLTGLGAGALHLLRPHPIQPYLAGGGLIIGIGLGFLLDDGSSGEADGGFDDEPRIVVISAVAALVGIAVLALGVTTPAPFPEVAAGGFALLLFGGVTTAYFESATEIERGGGTEAVPDDPTEWLEERGDD